MKFYGNDPMVPGQSKPPQARYAPKPTERKQGVVASVLRISAGGKVTRYPSISPPPIAAGVKQPTMSTWVRDGKKHRGYLWEREK